MKCLKLIMLLMLTALASCESMDDSYADLFDGSKKRYVGKCSDLKIDKGLDRFRMSWTNSADATIEKICVAWAYNTEGDTIVLPKGTTEYTTDAIFGNKSYELSVFALDGKGNKSIAVSDYSRPYTKDSELVNLMKYVQRSYYFIENQLLMFLYDSDRELETYVHYTSKGEAKVHKITAEEFEQLYLIIDEVDNDCEVSVKTTVKIEDCFDPIDFEAYPIDRTARNYAADLMNTLKARYDVPEVTPSILDTLTTLHVNTDISTLEDVLYMPKLKKVVLGGERYIDAKYSSTAKYMSKFSNLDATVLSLDMMRKLCNIELDVYGDQYQIKNLVDFETHQELTELPEISFFDMENWTVKSEYPVDDNGPLKNLIAMTEEGQPDKTNYWKPQEISADVRTHEIIIDMKKFNHLKGIYVGQNPSEGSWEKVTPEAIEVLLSKNNADWEQPFANARSIYLGKSPGETTLINFAETKTARYVKIIVKDKVTSGNNYVVLSSFVPFE